MFYLSAFTKFSVVKENSCFVVFFIFLTIVRHGKLEFCTEMSEV